MLKIIKLAALLSVLIVTIALGGILQPEAGTLGSITVSLNALEGFLGGITEVTTATYTVLDTDYHISIQYTDTGTQATTLPAISADTHGQIYFLKDADYNASNNNITINTTGSDTIEEAASGTMTADGEAWEVIANNTTKNWELR